MFVQMLIYVRVVMSNILLRLREVTAVIEKRWFLKSLRGEMQFKDPMKKSKLEGIIFSVVAVKVDI